MGWLRRAAPAIVVGLGLITFAERWVNGQAGGMPAAPVVAGIAPLAGGGCLARDTVLAALAARGVTAHPEVPAFCHDPADLPRWYALDPVGPDGTHLAFDAAGCLALWQPVPCPAP